MKCINKKPLGARQKEVQKKLFLIALLSLILLVGILSLIFLSKRKELKEVSPYDKSIRVFGTDVQENTLVAEGIGNYLCVGADNTRMPGIYPYEEERTALFDIKNKEIPFSQGLYEPVAPGRITQLMTVLLAYEKLDMEKSVTIAPEDQLRGRGVTICGLSAGSELSAKQLLNAVLVYSAEDACLALARTAGKTVENFVDSMNTRAQELGMTNTHFVNVTGYSDEDQYTTIYDVYLLLNALLEYPDLINAMSLESYTLNYTRTNGEVKQKWLDTDNLYVSGKITVPKGVTVLGGKSMASKYINYTALLVQNNYGDAFAVIVFNANSQSDMLERIEQMLEKINS